MSRREVLSPRSTLISSPFEDHARVPRRPAGLPPARRRKRPATRSVVEDELYGLSARPQTSVLSAQGSLSQSSRPRTTAAAGAGGDAAPLWSTEQSALLEADSVQQQDSLAGVSRIPWGSPRVMTPRQVQREARQNTPAVLRRPATSVRDTTVPVRNLGLPVHASADELSAGASDDVVPLMLAEWLDAYEEEKWSFHSTAVYAELKLQEASQLTAALEQPNAFVVAVACDVLRKLIPLMGAAQGLADMLHREMLQAIFVSPDPGASARELLGAPSFLRQVKLFSEDIARLEAQRDHLRASQHTTARTIRKIKFECEIKLKHCAGAIVAAAFHAWRAHFDHSRQTFARVQRLFGHWHNSGTDFVRRVMVRWHSYAADEKVNRLRIEASNSAEDAELREADLANTRVRLQNTLAEEKQLRELLEELERKIAEKQQQLETLSAQLASSASREHIVLTQSQMWADMAAAVVYPALARLSQRHSLWHLHAGALRAPQLRAGVEAPALDWAGRWLRQTGFPRKLERLADPQALRVVMERVAEATGLGRPPSPTLTGGPPSRSSSASGRSRTATSNTLRGRGLLAAAAAAAVPEEPEPEPDPSDEDEAAERAAERATATAVLQQVARITSTSFGRDGEGFRPEMEPLATSRELLEGSAAAVGALVHDVAMCAQPVAQPVALDPSGEGREAISAAAVAPELDAVHTTWEAIAGPPPADLQHPGAPAGAEDAADDVATQRARSDSSVNAAAAATAAVAAAAANAAAAAAAADHAGGAPIDVERVTLRELEELCGVSRQLVAGVAKREAQGREARGAMWAAQAAASDATWAALAEACVRGAPAEEAPAASSEGEVLDAESPYVTVKKRRLLDILKRVANATTAYEEVVQVLWSHGALLKKAFHLFAGADDDMDEAEFWAFAKQSGLKGELPADAITAAYRRVVGAAEGAEAGGAEPDTERGLLPGDFAELIVRLSVARYPRGAALALRVQQLLDEHVTPGIGRAQLSAFRQQLAQPEFKAVLHRHRKTLKRVYAKYSKADAGARDALRTMNLTEWIAFVKDCKMLGSSVNSRDTHRLFVMCNLADGAAAVSASNSASELIFSEFCDAVVALTCYRFPDPFLPLSHRVAQFMAKVVVPLGRGR